MPSSKPFGYYNDLQGLHRSNSGTPRRRRKSLLGLLTVVGATLFLVHVSCRWLSTSYVAFEETASIGRAITAADAGEPAAEAGSLEGVDSNGLLKLSMFPPNPDYSCDLTSKNNFNDTSKVKRPVWWFAPFFSGTGYGSEALDFVLAMYRSKLFSPRGLWISQHGDHAKPLASLGLTSSDVEDLDNMGTSVCTNSPAIVICHSTATNWFQGSTGEGEHACPPNGTYHYSYLIGRTMFETDRLPKSFILQSRKMNEIWVPTQFARNIFINAGLSPSQVFVVGEPINTTFFNPELYSPIPLPFGQLIIGTPKSVAGMAVARSTGRTVKKPFIFLTNFKFEPRKGWDVLLAAYLLAFQASDNVELYIITKPFMQNVNMNEFVKLTALAIMNKIRGEGRHNLASMPTVYLDTSYIPKDSLPRYYRAADAFVLPSRGEGWGRPHVEAMSMGLPLLATNWSGPTEFLDDSVGYPVRVEDLVDADPSNGELFRGHKWAQPSVGHLAKLLRHVYEHPEEAAAKGHAARQRMVQRYSPSALAAEVEMQLRRVDTMLGNVYSTNLAPKVEDQPRLQKLKRRFPWRVKGFDTNPHFTGQPQAA